MKSNSLEKPTHKKIYLAITITATLFGIIAKGGYRTWILENGINDFGIHNFLPSFLFVFGICFYAAWFSKNKKQLQAMVIFTLGASGYEFAQIWTKRTFDYMDIGAILVGLLLAVVIFQTIEYFYTK